MFSEMLVHGWLTALFLGSCETDHSGRCVVHFMVTRKQRERQEGRGWRYVIPFRACPMTYFINKALSTKNTTIL
jgi:hypothetical protein